MRAFVNTTSMLLAVAIVLRPIELAGEVMPYGALGAVALAAIALTLYTQDWVLSGPGVALVIAEYLWALNATDAGTDPAAPVLAVACLLLLELVDLSLLLSGPQPQRKVLVRHGRYVVVVAVAGAVLAVTAWAGGGVLGGSAVSLLLGAALAGVGALTIALHSVRRALSEGTEP